MQLISPINLFKTSPFIGANLFYLKFSSLKIYKSSYLKCYGAGTDGTVTELKIDVTELL